MVKVRARSEEHRQMLIWTRWRNTGMRMAVVDLMEQRGVGSRSEPSGRRQRSPESIPNITRRRGEQARIDRGDIHARARLNGTECSATPVADLRSSQTLHRYAPSKCRMASDLTKNRYDCNDTIHDTSQGTKALPHRTLIVGRLMHHLLTSKAYCSVPPTTKRAAVYQPLLPSMSSSVSSSVFLLCRVLERAAYHCA